MYTLLTALSAGIITSAVLAVATVGFSLQFGITNYINVAIGDYMTVSAFFWYGLEAGFHLPLWLAAVFAVLAGGIMSVLINRLVLMPVYRRRWARPFIMMIVTFAVSVVIENMLLGIWGSDSFTIPVSNRNLFNANGFALTGPDVVIVVTVILGMIALHSLLTMTQFGRAMRAMADNENLAATCGVPTTMITDLTWFISGLFAGLGGCALAIQLATMNNTAGSADLWLIIPAAFAGGIGNPYGAVAGAAVVGFGVEFTSQYLGSQYQVIVGAALLVLVILVRPRGIFGSAARALA